MAVCDTCGNDYDKAFQIKFNGTVKTFDCFECAIHALAPVCSHCGCKVVGHGVEQEEQIYCCANCARAEGSTELVDRSSAR